MGETRPAPRFHRPSWKLSGCLFSLQFENVHKYPYLQHTGELGAKAS
jgi:hypothetical protein